MPPVVGFVDIVGLSLDSKEEVKEMFYHAYNNYLDHAFPKDELCPLSCTGRDTWGSYALTLVDALDTLVVLGNCSEFERAVKIVISNVQFDMDKNVSVFETNIRILGGLISSHLFAEKWFHDGICGDNISASSDTFLKRASHSHPNTCLSAEDDAECHSNEERKEKLNRRHHGNDQETFVYTGQLLQMAIDLAERLMPAFSTPTGIPYGTVNLRHGVPPKETTVSSLACGGTTILEFGMLSRLTQDPKYEIAARTALRAIWARRSKLDLVGNHIDVAQGTWTYHDAGIGPNQDSFYEYLLKAYILLGDSEYLAMFQDFYISTHQYMKKGDWYVDVNSYRGTQTLPWFTALSAFWPGLQVLYGDIVSATKTMFSFRSIWRRFGFVPEALDVMQDKIVEKQDAYFLRPEMMESTMYLYQATKDVRA
jgi:mannosidase alpha-like ER degradation enhancer 2